MTEKLFILICEIALGITTVSGVVVILAATWYDLRSIRQKSHLNALAKKLHISDQPSITILIYAHNNATTIKACLESISDNRYANYQILVVDNGSTDATKQIITTYKKTHPGLALTMQSRRKPVDHSTLLRLTYSKLPASELILQISAVDMLSQTLLEDSAIRFAADNKLNILRLSLSSNEELNIATLPHHFLLLSRNMLHKSITPFSKARRHTLDGSIIKRAILTKEHSTNSPITSYASTIALIRPSPVINRKQQNISANYPSTLASLVVTFTKYVCLFLFILMITYFLYTAATLKSNILLILSWLVVCFWLLATIWSDDITKFSKKIELSLTVPFMYFLFYVHLIAYYLWTIWKIVTAIPLPDFSLKRLRSAIQKELYSTQY